MHYVKTFFLKRKLSGPASDKNARHAMNRVLRLVDLFSSEAQQK